MAAPLFSIVIPAFNRASLLRETLDSVFAQAFTNYEVNVVDDGSTDNTAEVLARYAGKLHYSAQANHGPGAARNSGAFRASGEYLAFLDSDDVFFPWSLRKYAELISAHRKPAFVAGMPFRFEKVTQISDVSDGPVVAKAFPDYFASGDEWRWWGASSFVVRRDALLAVGGFTDEWINGEDADLAIRLGVSAGFVQVTAPHTFGYREHAASAMKSLPKTLEGAWHKVIAERAGQYPGGPARARERWRILTRHVRPVTLECVRQGFRREAWGLYRATCGWNAALGRWKYLFGFPLKALFLR